MWPLYPLPRLEAFKVDQWCGPDGYMRELGRAERYRLDRAAVRAWRRSWRGPRSTTSERALREHAGAYVMYALWSAMRHKAKVAASAPDAETRFAMRANLGKFITWHVLELVRYGRTIEGRAAAIELSRLLYLSLVEPEALHGAEYTWTPREYCEAMNALLGVGHPWDDGTELMRHSARLEGYL